MCHGTTTNDDGDNDDGDIDDGDKDDGDNDDGTMKVSDNYEKLKI